MTIISNILRFLGKEFLDRSLIQQRSTQNSQHFVGTPVQFEVVLNDSHHAICGDGRVYLDSDSSLGRTPNGSPRTIRKKLNISRLRIIFYFIPISHKNGRQPSHSCSSGRTQKSQWFTTSLPMLTVRVSFEGLVMLPRG